MIRTLLASLSLFAALAAAPLAAQEAADPRLTEPPALAGAKRARVQMAILLDTSSSMNGLIHQAKTQLWQIVNELALAKRDGESVDLELAFYEYGKNTLAEQNHWVRSIVPLTTNLDKVSEELHALGTAPRAGGDEWPGAVIQHAVRELAWSESNDDLKVIFVAGNETFAQGPIDYRGSCREAITRGIIVNTIHCGDHATGLAQGWSDAPRLADGSFVSIDQNRAVTQLAAPQDAQIQALNQALNSTYLPYGVEGKLGLERQSDQDKAAEQARDGSAVSRAATKASGLYRNDTWDLVDAVTTGRVRLESIDRSKLPATLKDLSLEECRQHIDAQAVRRKSIQEQIQALSQTRSLWLATARDAVRATLGGGTASRAPAAPGNASRQRAESPGQSVESAARSANGATPVPARALGDAVIETLRGQAAKKGIEVGEPKPAAPPPEVQQAEAPPVDAPKAEAQQAKAPQVDAPKAESSDALR